MSKKKSKWIPFIEKIRFKYRVSILNENTLEESWHVRLSRLSVMIYACLLALFTFILLTILIIATPFRYYLPGYGESNKAETIHFSMQVDSLTTEVNLQNAYIEIVKDILSGKISADSVARLDSLVVKEKADQLGEKSNEEKQFTGNFENDQKFNLSVIPTRAAENIFVSFKPVKGVISTPFNPENNFYGVNIITSPNEAVMCVFPGTVISASFTIDAGYVIQVQHVNDYVSTYKNNTKLLKKVGDVVKAGESIAITGSNVEDKKTFYFELWKNGRPVNPEDVIIF
jgi:murein DD-endopeptidase MepM/ murein hydrolase activator NlpD